MEGIKSIRNWFLLIIVIVLQYIPQLSLIGASPETLTGRVVLASVFGLIILWFVLRYYREQLDYPRINLKAIAVVSLGIIMIWLTRLLTFIMLQNVYPMENVSENQEAIEFLFELFGSLSLIALFAIYGPILEEVRYRICIQKNILGGFPKFVGIVISAVLFGFSHYRSNLYAVIPYIAFGFVTALAYDKEKSIYIPIAIHMGVNAVAVSFMVAGIS